MKSNEKKRPKFPDSKIQFVKEFDSSNCIHCQVILSP